MAECQLPKLNTGVRFPSPAPHSRMLCVREFYYIPTKRPARITGRVNFFVLLHEKHTVVIELFARVLFELVEKILNGEL